jgi:hypothetical protein
MDVRSALEAHPVYSIWLDWSTRPGQSTPSFQNVISKNLAHNNVFVATGEKRGHCKVYRYCPELAMGPSIAKAGSTKGRRGPTDMGRRSRSMN